MTELIGVFLIAAIPIHKWLYWIVKKNQELQERQGDTQQLWVSNAVWVEFVSLLLLLGKGILIAHLLNTVLYLEDSTILIGLIGSFMLHTFSPLVVFKPDTKWHYVLVGIFSVYSPWMILISALFFVLGTALTNSIVLGELTTLLLFFIPIWFLDFPAYLIPVNISLFIIIFLLRSPQIMAILDNKKQTLKASFDNR